MDFGFGGELFELGELLQEGEGGYLGAGHDILGVPMAQMQVIQFQPQWNSPYGLVHTYQIDQVLIGMNTPDAVPVFNWAADIQVYTNTTFQAVAVYCFNAAYQQCLAYVGQPRSNTHYCQIRLLQTGFMLYDLTSDMLPVDDVLLDFINLYLMMVQSNSNQTLQMNRNEFQFRYTFVLSNGVTAALNENNIGRVKVFSNNLASNDLQSRTSLLASRNRYLAQRQNHSLGRHRFDIVNDPFAVQPVFNMQNVDALKQKRKLVSMAVDAKKIRKPKKKKLMNGTTANVEVDQEDEYVAPKVRERPKWTQDQKDKYNEARRQKRLVSGSGGEVRGIYDKLKSRIFHHTSIEEYFLNTKAALRVPTTWDEGFCIPMAFLKSEMRTYKMDGKLVLESVPAPLPLAEDYITCPILPNHEAMLADKHCDFLHDNLVVMFNPFKQPNEDSSAGASKYQEIMPPVLLRHWFAAAQNVHEYVCSQVEFELDANDPHCLQAYADVFEVYIAVYHLEVQGRRAKILKPSHFHADNRKRDSFSVVSLLISENHATAITSLRDFLKNKSTANRSTLYNYCVFCEKNKTANNETIADSQAHFVKCCEEQYGLLTCDGDKVSRSKMVKDVCPTPFMFDKKLKILRCNLCREEVVGDYNGQMEHVCFMRKPDNLKVGEESDVYVYDLECAQIKDEVHNVFIHECNLVCVRRAYPDPATGDKDAHSFETIGEFVAWVLEAKERPRVYLAHNGSKYDAQFIVKYLEKNLIAHTFVPSPCSMHAYLSLTIPFGASCFATFIDFRHFMPGSLKNIVLSFGLSVAKGDFPHHFNNGFNDFYEGAIPELNHESDYWCLGSKRTQEDIDEFKEWYASQQEIYCTCASEICICAKRKWSFKVEILKYCWLDVDVLAEACQKYRDNALAFGVDEETNEGWVSKGIDPFQYLTIPQLALNLLLAGSPVEEQITITMTKNRRDRSVKAVPWLERESRSLGQKILHIGNHHREYFCPRTKRYVDGVSRGPEKHFYVCLVCNFHACPSCFFEEIQTGVDHPGRPGTYGKVYRDTTNYITELLGMYGSERMHIIWEHDLDNLSVYEVQLGEVMKEREMFYGGRTEVFSPYVNVELFPETKLQYHDVCSLYPYVCAFKELPTGHPESFLGSDIDIARLTDLEHPDRYFGYIRCTVEPNRRDVLGLLPFRDPVSGRLEFPLHPMTGSWGTQELELAIRAGYQITNVFEVLHWSKEERSDTLLRGYVSFFLRMKQEAEGWIKLGATSENPSDEEKANLVARVFRENGHIAHIRPDKVAKNPVKRQMAKLFLNSLWGKFCQKPHSENYVVINGYQQFASLWFDPAIDRSKFCFRHISGQTWKVKYNHLTDFTRPNAKYNIFLAAKVTEWARCVLHSQMIRITKYYHEFQRGPAPSIHFNPIVYCDTDSIIFVYPSNGPALCGNGLGNWVDEHPHDVIKRFYGLAPKFYYLEFDGGDHDLLKSKGIQMTMHNASLITGKSLGKQLLEKFFPRSEEGVLQPFKGYLPMKNMLMGINTVSTKFEYGSMLTRFTEDKKLGPVISKRQLVHYTLEDNVEYDESVLEYFPQFMTIPKGYFAPIEEVAEDCYDGLLECYYEI